MDLTADDESWEELTQSVTPLRKTPRDIERPSTRLKVTPKISNNLVYNGNKLKDLAFGDTANIDANTARNFRRGKYQIEAELDLHGYTEDSAYDKVINFIKNAYLRKLRCVCIITGKGLHIESDCDFFCPRGVLKDRVPQWLNLPEIRSLILAIDHPEPKDGGSGVIRILLRRQRN